MNIDYISDTAKQVLRFAGEAHASIWAAGGDVSGQTKKAQAVCRLWQSSVLRAFPNRFRSEACITPTGWGQKLDLLDEEERTAFEMKVSPNNTHFEFYRDVFKVLVYNKRHPRDPIKNLIFLAPDRGIQQLGTEFPGDVIEIAAGLGLTVKLHSLGKTLVEAS